MQSVAYPEHGEDGLDTSFSSELGEDINDICAHVDDDVGHGPLKCDALAEDPLASWPDPDDLDTSVGSELGEDLSGFCAHLNDEPGHGPFEDPSRQH